MFGGNNGNRVLPVFLNDVHFQYQPNVANQLPLSGNLQAGYSTDPINYFSNEHIASTIQPNKQSTEIDVLQQRLQISLYNNYNVCIDDADQLAIIPNPNPVSTGLRLAFDDDEHNSSVTSASGNMTAAPIIFSLGDSIRTEFDRQQEEMDRYIKLQKEQLSKGIRDMRQKHMDSLLSSIEKGLSKKLMEKDAEIANMNRKNRDLVEKINQVAIEAENWQLRASHNEAAVNILKNNLQQVISGMKEGYGDNEDDASSSVNPNNVLRIPGVPVRSTSKTSQGMEMMLTCKACNTKEVSVLLLPCRHLCLCKDCSSSIIFCPICRWVKTSSIHVQMS